MLRIEIEMISITTVIIICFCILLMVSMVAVFYFVKCKDNAYTVLGTQMKNSGKPIADGLDHIKIICK